MTEEILTDGVNVAECEHLEMNVEAYCPVIQMLCRGEDCYFKQLAREKQKNAKIELYNSGLETSNAELKQKNKELEAGIIKFNKDYNELKQKNEILQQSENEAKEIIADYKKENTDLKQKNEELEQRLEEAILNDNMMCINALNDEVMELKQKNEKLVKELENMHRFCAELSEEKEDLDKCSFLGAKQIVELQTANYKLTETLKDIRKTVWRDNNQISIIQKLSTISRRVNEVLGNE